MANELDMFMFSFLGFWVAVAFVVWVIVSNRRRSRVIQTVTDFHNRLLDKLGSTRDFADFLQSEGGSRFLATLSTERVNPNQRILNSIQTGTVLLLLGTGLLVLGWTLQKGEGFFVLGTISLSLGLGFLISSAVSYRLSKSGLLDERPPGGGPQAR